MGTEAAAKTDQPPRYTPQRATQASRPESSRAAGHNNRIAPAEDQGEPPPYEQCSVDPITEVSNHDKRVRIEVAIRALESVKLTEGLVVLLLPSHRKLASGHKLTGWRYDAEPKSILMLPEEAGDVEFWEMLEPTMQVRLWLHERQPHGLVSDIDVHLEEVFFRREGAFGLFETTGWMALTVEMGRLRPGYHRS